MNLWLTYLLFDAFMRAYFDAYFKTFVSFASRQVVP